MDRNKQSNDTKRLEERSDSALTSWWLTYLLVPFIMLGAWAYTGISNRINEVLRERKIQQDYQVYVGEYGRDYSYPDWPVRETKRVRDSRLLSH